MNMKVYLLILIFGASFFSIASKSIDYSWFEGFDDTVTKDNILWPENWQLKTKFGTPAAKFSVVSENKENVLHMEADKASGTLLRGAEIVDLKKTPVLRWKWRAISLPKGGDGRYQSKDDQAIGIYVGTGRWKQDSIAYRWETDTPKGTEDSISYGGGLIKVKWKCMRNKQDKMNTWFEEKCNVAEDFKSKFGYIPKEIAITVVTNSQHTGTKAVAELSWIGFTKDQQSK